MQEYDVPRLRDLQMNLLKLSFEDKWGQHLVQAREELKQEALHFVKEQRVRCLLQGSWFERPAQKSSGGPPWRFAKLSHNKRYLHYADFTSQPAHDPVLGSLPEKVDLNSISSVVSNVSAGEDTKSTSSDLTLKTSKSTTKITINTEVSGKEQAVLTLWPTSHSLASEWLDGLLMLLGQAPITAETNKLVNLVSDYGLKIRLLNVRMDSAFEGPPPGAGVVPSRKGLDEDYFFEV